MSRKLTKTELLQKAMTDGQLPRMLYKYRALGEWTEKIITEATLHFANPMKFNDPFDFQIVDRGQYSDAELAEYLRRNGVPEAEIDTTVLGVRRSNGLLDIVEAAKRKIFVASGVVCFSTLADSILMWSHYSANHGGVVLEFDVERDLDFFLIPVRVHYELEYPVTRLLMDGDSAVEKCIRTKHKAWEYESEVRVVKAANGSMNFKKEALTGIYFGCNATRDTIDRYCALLDGNGYGHVKRYQAFKVDAEFRIDFQSV